MKITSLQDIDNLKVGDTYTIEPKGIDFNTPESIDFKAINEIQKAIEAKFNTLVDNNGIGDDKRKKK